MEGGTNPDSEESKTNFFKQTLVKLTLTEIISVKTPMDEWDMYLSCFAMFPDGRIVVADCGNRLIKLFDHKGKHLFSTKPRYIPIRLAIGYNSEILVSTCPVYQHIIQIFNVEHDTISIKETIETEFEIGGLAALGDRIIATVVEKDCIPNYLVTAKLFGRNGEVYWTTVLETPFQLYTIICVQEKDETFCIMLDNFHDFMIKLNARTGRVIHERPEKSDDENKSACEIFYFSSESIYADDIKLMVCSSDLRNHRIVATNDLGFWPKHIHYDEKRKIIQIAYDSQQSNRKDRIDIFKVVDDTQKT